MFFWCIEMSYLVVKEGLVSRRTWFRAQLVTHWPCGSGPAIPFPIPNLEMGKNNDAHPCWEV